MRASDLERLREQYGEDIPSVSGGPMPALGVNIPDWRLLESLILADLTEQFPYGIGWWAPHPGTKRRILISDQLYACTASVSDNMVEAGLHWLEFLDNSERDGARHADAVKLRDGHPIVEPPPCDNPLQELGPSLVRIHVVGVIRALAGALDCLAGTAIGVLALSKDILRADFGSVRSALLKMPKASTVGGKRQSEFGQRLESHIGAVGPQGWLEWLLAFRNMLVHRGRRIEMGQYLPKAVALYGHDGQRVLRADRVTHLPREPLRSDIDVFLNSPQALLLSEDASQTLYGLLDSTKLFLQMVAKDLMEVWNWRRSDPEGLLQPEAQWPVLFANKSIGFAGYKPGTPALPPSAQMIMHPIQARRFRSAALEDMSRPQWDSFD